MEMVVEGQHRPNSAPKRIEFQRIMEKGEEDRISSLTDCLVLEILSRLPSLKDAIRTGALSKRWIHLWTSIPTLIFSFRDFNLPPPDFVSLVDKTLSQCHGSKLRKFHVYTSYEIGFQSQVNNWVRYAITCNVEQLILEFCTFEREYFILDQFFFTNSCFTDLSLRSCVFNPTGAIRWNNLKSLCISCGKIDENLIENILSGSPVLETLVLDYCYGYKLLNITSKSVKNLVLNNYAALDNPYDSNIIIINAPNILSLTINGALLLWMLFLLNVSSLVEANLDYVKGGYWETTREKTEEEMLKGFLLKLRHVKELRIGESCYEVLFRLEAKGYDLPSNMRFLDVLIYWSDSDSVESGDCASVESEICDV